MGKGNNGVVWSGEWVARRLGVSLEGGDELRELLGLALRRNPKRAHLLVSNVLGKHVPQRPSVVHGAGVRLGRRVRELLGDEEAARAVVLGYAETATGLGHSVADGLALASYLHSTRRPVNGVKCAGGFEEEHSHATSHLLLPEDPELLAREGPLVLVDDEFSTGRTVLNTVRALHTRYPRERYVIVALVDMRAEKDRGALEKCAAELGARVDLVSLAAGTVRLPAGVLARGRALVTERSAAAADAPAESDERGRTATAAVTHVELGWPRGLPDGARHGFEPRHRIRLESALPAMAARIAEVLGNGNCDGGGRPMRVGAPVGGRAVRDGAARTQTGPAVAGDPTVPRGQSGGGFGRVLVLGNEELMYAPLRIAGALDDRLEAEVFFSTTTRSPVLAVDDPGYAIRTGLAFPAHDRPADGPGERYAYNIAPGGAAGSRFDAIVAVVDSVGDTPQLHAPDGLLAKLAAHTDRLLLAVVPSHTPVPESAPALVDDERQV